MSMHLLQEDCDSTLLRVLHGIRKNPTVDSELDKTTPSKRKPKEHLPGKENSSAGIERPEALSSPFSLSPELPPHLVSQAAGSNDHSDPHSIGSVPSGHTGKDCTSTGRMSTPGIQD